MRFFLLLTLFCLNLHVISAQKRLHPAIGVQLYSFRDQFKTDVPGTMKKVQAMGLQTVETAGFYGMSVPEFKKMLEMHGLKAAGTGADFEALEDTQKLKTTAAEAKMLGATFVTCFWIPHQEGDFTLAEAQRAVTAFNTAGAYLKSQGLHLLYHPHGYEFRKAPNGGYLLDYLIQQTNPKFVNFEMDIYWIKCPGQDPVEWLKKYPKRWKTLHVKDQKKGTPGDMNGRTDVEWNVTVGTGTQDMPLVMRQAKKNKIKYYFIEDESSRSLEQVPQSAQFLATYLKGR
jgi:sugar phosphate isomerase/epimerase